MMLVVIIIAITAVEWWLSSAYYRDKTGSWSESANSVHCMSCFCVVGMDYELYANPKFQYSNNYGDLKVLAINGGILVA